MFEKIICWIFKHRWTLPNGFGSSHRVCNRCNKHDELGALIPDSWMDLLIDCPPPFCVEAWHSEFLTNSENDTS